VNCEARRLAVAFAIGALTTTDCVASLTRGAMKSILPVATTLSLSLPRSSTSRPG
jgi:hypothetical protein